MKVKVSDVNKMIKEEFQKMLEKKKLSARLNQINESLAQMNEEDANLNEVEAGGETTVASNAWTGKPNGDVKWKPEFEKKGSSLKEDGSEEIEGAIEGPEGMETAEVSENPMGEFEAKFAEIGKAIDTKLSNEIGAGAGASMIDEPKDDDFEEVEVDGPSTEGSEDAEGSEGPKDSDEKEVDEYAEIHGGVGAEHGMTADQAMQKESVDEPLEGESVAQETDLSKPAGDMTKDTHVKEGKGNKGTVITEAKNAKGNIFTEGLDDKKKSALLSEMNRMSKFAGLTKDEE